MKLFIKLGDTDLYLNASARILSYVLKDLELSNVFKIQLKALKDGIIEKQEANANGTGSYTLTQDELDFLANAQQTIPALANANSTQIETEIANLEAALEQAQEDREYEINEAKTLWEDELEMIEAEANDVEVIYQQEQTEIETQLEHVTNELQAVKDSTSSEIQNGTIRLS